MPYTVSITAFALIAPPPPPPPPPIVRYPVSQYDKNMTQSLSPTSWSVLSDNNIKVEYFLTFGRCFRSKMDQTCLNSLGLTTLTLIFNLKTIWRIRKSGYTVFFVRPIRKLMKDNGISFTEIDLQSNHKCDVYYRQLTHWGRVTHICVGKQTIIGSDNGLSPGRRQAIIWTNDGILLMVPWEQNSMKF